MPSREDNDTERNVRIEADESAKNGRNGKNVNLVVEPSTQVRGENSVERSLEDFIARANSTFLEADGWDLTPEPEKIPEPAPAPPPPVVTAAPEPAPPVVERTEVVSRAAFDAEPQIITRTSWGAVIGAFLAGGAAVFLVLKLTATPAAQPDVPAIPAAAPAPAATPAPVPAAVPDPVPAPAAVPAPAGALPPAPGAPAGPVVEPLPVEPAPAVAAKPDKKVEPKKPEKKDRPKKAEPKKAEPKKVKPKKDSAPKGGIVDPFAM